MTAWQVGALVLAFVLPITGAIGYFRSRRVSVLILLAQIGLFFEVGAIIYVIEPGSEPSLTPLLLLAFGLIAVDFVVMLWSIVLRRRLLSKPISISQLDRVNDRARVSRVLTVLALSALLANFEPWLGVAMLLFFVATTAVWLPVRCRRYGLELTTDLPAPPGAVFPYLVDPAKWNLYRSSDIKVVKVTPSGPLAAGSRVISLMPVSVGKSFKPFMLETTTEVTGLDPDEQLSTVWIERPYERSNTRLEPTPSGTRLNFQLHAVMPFWLAAMGVMFDVRRMVAQRRAEMDANYVRLRAILQAVPAQ